MQSTAQLIQSDTGWNIRYLNGTRAEQVRELFGTDTLPLPYGGGMPLWQVIDNFRIQAAVLSIASDGYVVLA